MIVNLKCGHFGHNQWSPSLLSLALTCVSCAPLWILRTAAVFQSMELAHLGVLLSTCFTPCVSCSSFSGYGLLTLWLRVVVGCAPI